MPIAIEEVTAEVEPRPPEAPAARPSSGSREAPEIEVRKQCELLRRLEIRAARVRAD